MKLCETIIMGSLCVCAAGCFVRNIKMKKKIQSIENLSDKHLAIVSLFSMWMENRENNLKISDYLRRRGIENVAIYGMSYVGERLYDELINDNIKVLYCIDSNSNNIYKDVDVYSPNSFPENGVDAIIVTAFTFFDDIEKRIKERTDIPVISIDDIVYSL